MIPIGAGVRSRTDNRLGRIIRPKPRTRPRGCYLVLWDGRAEPVWMRTTEVQYVAITYEAAKQWEERQ